MLVEMSGRPLKMGDLVLYAVVGYDAYGIVTGDNSYFALDSENHSYDKNQCYVYLVENPTQREQEIKLQLNALYQQKAINKANKGIVYNPLDVVMDELGFHYLYLGDCSCKLPDNIVHDVSNEHFKLLLKMCGSHGHTYISLSSYKYENESEWVNRIKDVGLYLESSNLVASVYAPKHHIFSFKNNYGFAILYATKTKSKKFVKVECNLADRLSIPMQVPVYMIPGKVPQGKLYLTVSDV